MTYAGKLIYDINTAPDNIFTSIFNNDFELAESMGRRNTYKKYKALQFLTRVRASATENTPGDIAFATQMAADDIADVSASHYIPIAQRWKPFIQTASDYTEISPSGIATFDGELVFTFERQDNFRLLGDMFIYVELAGLAAIPPTCPNPTPCDYDFVNYADFPAHALFSSIRLRSDQSILDELLPSTYNNHYNFMVSGHRKGQWRYLVGQEEPTVAYLMTDPGTYPYREQRYITDGLQTPKSEHTIARFCLPLIFDFPSRTQVLPSPVIIDSKISIVCTINRSNLICESNKNRAFTLPTFKRVFMGARYIYCGDKIREILIKSSQMNLTRVHRFQRTEVVSEIAEIDLRNIRGPIEWLIITVRPSSQVLLSTAGALQTWHLSGKITPVLVPFAVGAFSDPGTHASPIAAAQVGFYTKIEETVIAVEVVLGSETIYKKAQPIVSSGYSPYEFNTAAECIPGTHFVPFSALFKKYQPSGYIDAIRGGGLVLRLTTHASSTHPMLVDVSAESLNFVKVENGTAAIKFV